MTPTVFAVVVAPEWLWVGAAAVLFSAIVAGFVAGVICAPALQDWMLHRAARSIQRLYNATLAQMERSERLCRQLGEASGEAISPPQWSRLDDLAQRFQEAWKSAVERHAPPKDAASAAEAAPSGFTMEWKRTTVDAVTQLPDRASLDENLAALLSSSTAASHPSGLLLVALDKGDQLRRRFGSEVAHVLEAKLATVLIKAARDLDLVCRVGPDTFAVLLPSVSPLAGARVAEALRSAVRQHRFRASETGPEVVVTASFGYTACLPGDPPTLVLDRAGAALAKSQTCGRNQLHVHDAYHQTLCRVG